MSFQLPEIYELIAVTGIADVDLYYVLVSVTLM